MMIELSIFARSDAILSDQNACYLSYNIIKKGLENVLLDQDDRANKFCPIISVIDLINDPAYRLSIKSERVDDYN